MNPTHMLIHTFFNNFALFKFILFTFTVPFEDHMKLDYLNEIADMLWGWISFLAYNFVPHSFTLIVLYSLDKQLG